MTTPKMVLPVVIGNDEDFEFHCKDSAGADFDLTGSTIAFEFTQDNGTTWVTLTVGVDAAITCPTPTNGEVLLSLTDTHTGSMVKGTQERWKLTRTISSKTKTLVYGPILATSDE